jgi:hypothetical protein
VVAAISREHLRRILKASGVSWQTTTTWKSSNDPDFIAKMTRILALYDWAPQDGRVICVDEFGPLNLQPRTGKAWRPVRSPARLRATFNRDHGVMHLIGALDLATGKLLPDPPSQTLAGVPGVPQVAAPALAGRSPIRREWAAGNDVDLVFLPTYGSWLNWIESEFAALRYFALNGTDHHTHAEQNAAIAAYIRWHNRYAQPKANFAASSPIRSWTSYPAKVA